MKKVLPLCLVLLILAFSGFKNPRSDASNKQNSTPNILYLVADDAGRDMSAYGVNDSDL